MKTQKTKTIIIRGIKVKVNQKHAARWEAVERQLIRKDWANNSLD